jgi:CYTH domain-containing protein
VAKTRYTVEHGGARWEIDEFGGTLAGLYLAELELVRVRDGGAPRHSCPLCET